MPLFGSSLAWIVTKKTARLVDHCEIVDRVLGQEIERRKNVGPVSLAKGNVVKEEFVRLTIFAGERADSLCATSLAAGAEFLG